MTVFELKLAERRNRLAYGGNLNLGGNLADGGNMAAGGLSTHLNGGWRGGGEPKWRMGGAEAKNTSAGYRICASPSDSVTRLIVE
jgi:hypothetical protein